MDKTNLILTDLKDLIKQGKLSPDSVIFIDLFEAINETIEANNKALNEALNNAIKTQPRSDKSTESITFDTTNISKQIEAIIAHNKGLLTEISNVIKTLGNSKPSDNKELVEAINNTAKAKQAEEWSFTIHRDDSNSISKINAKRIK